MGRPKAENPKSTQVTVRMDADTTRKMAVVMEQYGISKVEALRRGIDKLFSEIKGKEKR